MMAYFQYGYYRRFRWMGFVIWFLIGCASPKAPTVITVGNTSTWSQQIRYAQTEASKIDPQAQLQKVTFYADTISSRTGDRQTTFFFVQPSGTIIRVEFQTDHAKQSITITTVPKGASRLKFLAGDILQCYQQAMRSITISPFMVQQITAKQAQSFFAQTQDEPDTLIELEVCNDNTARLHTPALWQVTYIRTGKQLRIWVDAQQGIILDEEEQNL